MNFQLDPTAPNGITMAQKTAIVSAGGTTVTNSGTSTAAQVSYDDTNIQTSTSGLIQADDVQEVLDDFINLFAPYVTVLLGRVPPAGGTTGQILSKDTDTDYDYAWIDAPTGGSTSAGAGFEYQDIDRGTTYVYVGYAHPITNHWFIYRRTLNDGTREYATGTSGYATNWTNRASLTYS